MIKAAIMGADSLLSGELIRILAIHPDVELVAAQARGLEGIPLSDVHHGLIGETNLQFSSSIDLSNVHVVFADASQVSTDDLWNMGLSGTGPKVILMGDSDRAVNGTAGVYGLPEIYRKPLVRGAQAAVVPLPFASMALVALYPFAINLLLSGDIEINLAASDALLEEFDVRKAALEIESELRQVQLSFNGKVNITTSDSDARRSAMMTIKFDCPLLQEQALQLYNMYDDHRFAFATTKTVSVSEVAGTDKCVVNVDKDSSDKIVLTVVADCRMRGGAGEAVHIMNLMFGLHEKTGLYLKAIDFDKIDTAEN